MNTERMAAETLRTEPMLPLGEALLPASPLADDDAEHVGQAATPGPRTRWAAIVWGVFFAILAWTGIWMLSSSTRRDDVTDWLAGLTPGTITAISLLSVGVLVLIAGVVGLIRRAQRAARPDQP